MDDPQFDAIVAEIRGFDLGDDSQLLAHLDAEVAKGLEGDEWLLRGVLLYRAGRHADAVQCMDQAADEGPERSTALYLKSCVLRELEHMGEAHEALEEAREAARQDGRLTAAELAHAQGLLFWKVGDRQEALIRVDEAIAASGHSAARWLHRGQLLAQLGRPDEAAAAFDRALLEEQDLDRAMIERAALEAARGDVAATIEWLDKAIRLDPDHRQRIANDPRFAALRKEAAAAELFGVARAAELGWLDALAPWMSALRRNGELARRGVEWLSRAHAERIGRALVTEYERGPLGTMHTSATLERSRELLETRRAVALGPGSRTREGVVERSVLFVDVARPREGLWLALSESYPPFLWIRLAPEPGAILGALAEYFPRPRRSRLDMSRQARGFLGYRSALLVPSPYTGGMEPATIVELDRHFALNPFVESTSWGSAYDDDPWPDQIPSQPGLVHKIAEHQRLVSEQARGHVWSLTRRTRHSRSYLTIEVHHREVFVAQLRYRPSPFVEVIEAMNAYFGCDYPTDMPVDAVAALLGFQFDGARDLEVELARATDPEQLAGLLLVLSALRHGDLGAIELYRRYVDHPAPVVRSTLADVAVACNHEVLLEEMSIREPDPDLRAEIEALLDEGIPVLEDDPYASDEEELEVEEILATDTTELDVVDVELQPDVGRKGGGA
ncbi:MAG: tetratricopeptide repeat protein [Myxococcales bacterium]|nr:tetratricopeptide repeat protein [Myxococcales bacterium]